MVPSSLALGGIYFYDCTEPHVKDTRGEDGRGLCSQVISQRARRDGQRLLTTLEQPSLGSSWPVSPLLSQLQQNVDLSQVAQPFSRAGTQGGKGSGWYILSSLEWSAAKSEACSVG